MNTQHMMTEAVPYEPPRMTIVPIRATGAMLIGSPTTYNYFDRVDNDFILFDNDVDQHPTNQNEEYYNYSWNSAF